MDIRIETVHTDSFSMDYFRFGSGKRPLVILPGLSVQSVMGAATAVADAYGVFAEDYTVYVFDRRASLPPVYPIRAMAEDTAEALQTLGLKRVCLFGASQGGMIALHLALIHPELVEKLALGSSAARITDEGMAAQKAWISLAARGDRTGLYLSFGEKIYPPSVFEEYRAALTAAAETVTDEELRRFIILAEGMRGFDVLDELDGLRCPVLALGAADDRVLGPEAAAEIAERLGRRPDFEQYTYDGFGHAAYDTAPDYRDRLRCFFRE